MLYYYYINLLLLLIIIIINNYYNYYFIFTIIIHHHSLFEILLIKNLINPIGVSLCREENIITNIKDTKYLMVKKYK